MEEIEILGSKSRIKLLHELSKKDMYLSELIRNVKLDTKNCKHHLDILEKEGIISKKHKGKRTYYSLEKEILLHIMPPPQRRYEIQFFDVVKTEQL
ncbi:MAG: winged helix-turn-helix domain-containing protein [Thermoplasmatota archaeon]